MASQVKRVYVEKKAAYAGEARGILRDLTENLRMTGLTGVRLLNRYDIEGIDQTVYAKALHTIFSEPQVDTVYETELPAVAAGSRVFAVEYLPGQYDQRADSCQQCIQILTQGERPLVRTAKVYVLEGTLTDQEFARIRGYLINAVESREASLEIPETLAMATVPPEDVAVLEGFTQKSEEELSRMVSDMNLAMDAADLAFTQRYFRDEEKRDPTLTEIRVLDTYWSDHCRHTTFLTHIDGVSIEDPAIAETYRQFMADRAAYYGDRAASRPLTLMDMATLGAKVLRSQGLLQDLDESEEINACSVKIRVDVDGEMQDYLLMFKNETHNHPTEIEPFGGAATCLGGAIRDPLSGRSYVYQAMRVTGSGDPRATVEETMEGKLPQRKITVGAAQGYSSYGNQIGLATGQVQEYYHPGYVAKRLEIGAVVGAVPASHVRREAPVPGDVIVLIGGRTGRDGCGGATGSSQSHTLESIDTCSAQVQKGNPPEERKLQRLFRNPDFTTRVKRCNDFGAGGVCVAIGEIAPGLAIDLDKVPRKYEGLDGTELAISESQERMAVAVAAEDASQVIRLAGEENLEATVVARVTDTNRLVMTWRGKTLVDIARSFIDTNGADRGTQVFVGRVDAARVAACMPELAGESRAQKLRSLMGDLNIASQRGLVERFDASIGAATLTMPYGGKRQLTPVQAMAATIPVEGETTTASVMAHGFNPYLSQASPFLGGMTAVLESVAKLAAVGVDTTKIHLTFQEYFPRTQGDPARWGLPFAALLGSYAAQMGLKVASIGGKDSMSGTFMDLDVPPTLVSFAVGTIAAPTLVTGDFKAAGHRVVRASIARDAQGLPIWEDVLAQYAQVHEAIQAGHVAAAWALGWGGVAQAVTMMGLGNGIGFKAEGADDFFTPGWGDILMELTEDAPDALPGWSLVGRTQEEPAVDLGDGAVSLEELCALWEAPLEKVFPMTVKLSADESRLETFSAPGGPAIRRSTPAIARPRVVIPVFPGSNCELDTARAFERAGAQAQVLVLRNLTASALEESLQALEKAIRSSQMVMIPGGFSGGDEPEGSGKFIAAVLRSEGVADAIMELLHVRDGLMMGICNGFQALIKTGLVPYGEIRDMTGEDATLTFNAIGRHISRYASTRIASNRSPWLARCQVGEVYSIPLSHGEGRFVAPESLIRRLAENGQIATQYVDAAGNPTMDVNYNPNSSMYAIEGVLSPDGRVLGKMGHSERRGRYVGLNIAGEKDQQIFTAGVEYFTK